MMMKENIKSKALSCYLIRIKNNKFKIFDLHLEFKWYIDEYQLKLIRCLVLENDDSFKSNLKPILFINKLNLLNLICCKIFNLIKSSSIIEYSHFKMIDPSNLLKITNNFDISNSCQIEIDAFSTMNQLKSINNLSLTNGFCLAENHLTIKNGSFNGLSNLQCLKLGQCILHKNHRNLFSNLKNLKILQLEILNEIIDSNLFTGLSNLVELDVAFRNFTFFKIETTTNISEISFDELKNLKKLIISSLEVISNNYFKSLVKLEELTLKYMKTFEKDAFIYLANLETLDLCWNDFDVLESNVFNGLINLKVLILGQKKDNIFYRSRELFIQKDAFKGISKLEYLNLKEIKINILDENVFEDIKYLKRLELKDFCSLNFNPFRCFERLESISTDFNVFEQKLTKLISVNCLNKINELVVSVDNFENSINFIKNSQLNLSNLKISMIRLKGDEKQIQIIDLPAIKMLSLTGNLKFESISLKNLINLKDLDLSGNKILFTKNHNNLLSNLTNLFSLNLSFNLKFDVDSSFFIGLENLRLLNLEGTKCELKDKLFEHLTNLETLELANSSITNQELNELTFYGLKNLKKLNLSDSISISKIEKIVGNTFRQTINLVSLNLSGCGIRFIDLEAFNFLFKLEYLNLSINRIEKMNEQHFKQLINLKQLDLSSNPFIYQIDILQFYNNLNLKYLDLNVI